MLQQQESWITDDVIRRNLCGLIIGSVDTTNKVLTLVMQVLLKDKKYLKRAQEAAIQNDIQLLGKIMLEALRFNPHNPIVLRYSKKDSTVNFNDKKYTIPASSTLFIGIIS